MVDGTSFRRWTRTTTSEVWVLERADSPDGTVGELHLHYGEGGRVDATLCLEGEASDDDVATLLEALHEQLIRHEAEGAAPLVVHVWRGQKEQYAYQPHDPTPPRSRPAAARKAARRPAARKAK